jgi:hypothetical protein
VRGNEGECERNRLENGREKAKKRMWRKNGHEKDKKGKTPSKASQRWVTPFLGEINMVWA